MDTRSFLGLAPGRPTHWRFPVTPGLCSFSGNLFGGAVLAAGIEAMEAITGRRVVWASAQYLSFAKNGDVLDLEVVVPVEGHFTSQARVIGRVGDSEAFTVSGAFGTRPTTAEGRFATRPLVPRPLDCPERTWRLPNQESINQHVEMRLARGRDIDDLDGRPTPDGRSALWARMPGIDEMSASSLAILGDWVPFGVSQALGARAGGNSLDNTLRVVKLVPTDWVLLDIRIHAIHDGFAHGVVYQWAEDGSLLATASQSVKVRFWEDPGAQT